MSKHIDELTRLAGRAMHDYRMIQDNDRVLVGLSGGKDSLVLLEHLNRRLARIPISYHLVVAHLNPGYEDPIQTARLREFVGALKLEHYFEDTDFARTAHSSLNRENPCFLCARLRRQRLFELARQSNCTKVALGHHREDLIETLLLNIFYSGEISTMHPAQRFFDGLLTVIRPLCLVPEETIKQVARAWNLPVTTQACPSAHQSKRSEIKEIINTLAGKNQKVKGNMLRALSNVRTDYLLKVFPAEQGERRSGHLTDRHQPLQKLNSQEAEDMDSNQRRRTRVPFETTVKIVAGEQVLDNLASRDLSMKGMFLETETTLPLDTPVDITVELTGATSEVALRMKGRVVRVSPHGMGIDFTEVDLDSFFHLRNIVMYNAGDPGDVDSELATRPAF
ncbi:MAG: PilZ domain-containing protein [Deltaproteobacteria bacterium]|nr:PilZ domain-containing protein [Deltaproteobacteria bacterium]